MEAQLGSQLARHNLTVRQLGPDTSTEMSTFALSGHKQVSPWRGRGGRGKEETEVRGEGYRAMWGYWVDG